MSALTGPMSRGAPGGIRGSGIGVQGASDQIGERPAQSPQAVDVAHGEARRDHLRDRGDQRLEGEALGALRVERRGERVDEALLRLQPARDRLGAGGVDLDQEQPRELRLGGERIQVGAEPTLERLQPARAGAGPDLGISARSSPAAAS